MRFLADMGMSPQTVSFLQEKGHEADHLIERGRQQLEDPQVLALAHEEDRILLVHDLDFSVSETRIRWRMLPLERRSVTEHLGVRGRMNIHTPTLTPPAPPRPSAHARS